MTELTQKLYLCHGHDQLPSIKTKTLRTIHHLLCALTTRAIQYIERLPIQCSSRVTFFLLGTLAQGSDQVADVSNGDLKREIHRG